MKPRPPSSTRTDTRLPYTTLCRSAPRTTTGILVRVDAGMVAGFRRSKPSLGQLHQALVHLHRQHPDVRAAVLADPSLKWDLAGGEQTTFEGDIIAGAVVCAPAGALEGTVGFLTRAEIGRASCRERVWTYV